MLGRVLAGRYQLTDLLGSGAMGVVYRAEDQQEQRLCAVKVLHQAALLDKESYERFMNEARIASQLFHPNIVEVKEFNQDQGVPFLVMELLSGKDLYTLLEVQGRVPLDHALTIMRQVGSALHAAHGIGIVHRDIKPKNIFLSRERNRTGQEIEVVKVVDFGLSKMIGGKDQATRTGIIMGTPEYLAPEATYGRSEDVDTRADQWALGVVGYRMLSGALPFDSEDLVQLILQIRKEPHVPLRQRAPDLPKHVVEAIERTMHKDKAERFATIQDFMRALSGLAPLPAGTRDEAPSPLALLSSPMLNLQLDLPELVQKPPPPKEETRPEARKRRRLAAWVPVAVVLGLCAMAALAIAFLHFYLKPRARLVGGSENAEPADDRPPRVVSAGQQMPAQQEPDAGAADLAGDLDLGAQDLGAQDLGHGLAHGQKQRPPGPASAEPGTAPLGHAPPLVSPAAQLPPAHPEQVPGQQPTEELKLGRRPLEPEDRIAGANPTLPLFVKEQHLGSVVDGDYRICVDEHGVTRSVNKVTSIPLADESIMATLRTWRFHPWPASTCAIIHLQFPVE